MWKVIYERNGERWHAEVSQEEDNFRLRLANYRLGKAFHWQEAGMFKTGVAVVKYVRDYVSKNLTGWTMVADTLDAIKLRTASTVIPHCFSPVPAGVVGNGCGRSDCGSCPYRSSCGDEKSVALGSTKLTMKESEQEDDGKFLTRLRRKVQKVWGEKN
jgi:hypothetical protein